jgi:hypothetical protein
MKSYKLTKSGRTLTVEEQDLTNRVEEVFDTVLSQFDLYEIHQLASNHF